MSYSITDFLGLGNVLNTFVEENSFRIIIQIETLPHEVVCPDCGRTTKRVHDYRWQLIKSLPSVGNTSICAYVSVGAVARRQNFLATAPKGKYTTNITMWEFSCTPTFDTEPKLFEKSFPSPHLTLSKTLSILGSGKNKILKK